MARRVLIPTYGGFAVRSHLTSLLALTVSLPSAAWEVRTDSEGDVVVWKKPLEMVLDSRAVQLSEGALRKAFAHLEEATPALRVSVQAGAAKPMGYAVGAADNQNTVLQLDDWPFSDDALAATVVTLNARTNEILDADIAFNTKFHRFRELPVPIRDDRPFDDVQNTITHELGHALGLMHSRVAPDLVMYPSAPAGELQKRILKADDRDGLMSLYGQPPEEPSLGPGHTMGCSATSPSAPWHLLAMVMICLGRARRRAAVLIAFVPSLAFSGEPLPASIIGADDVALMEVKSRQAFEHPQHRGLIMTELLLEPVECLKGECLGLVRAVVAGGRLGEIEQVVVHEPVPIAGARVLVTRTGGRVRPLWVEGDEILRVGALLRSTRSSGTHGAAPPPLGVTQVPAITP